jgi:hypothetical protein
MLCVDLRQFTGEIIIKSTWWFVGKIARVSGKFIHC